MKIDKSELYIVASGIWGQHSNPENTQQNYIDYLSEIDKSVSWTFAEIFNEDNNMTTYEALKKIADQSPNWLQVDPEASNLDGLHVSSSVYLTKKQAKELEDTFYLQLMEELL